MPRKISPKPRSALRCVTAALFHRAAFGCAVEFFPNAENVREGVSVQRSVTSKPFVLPPERPAREGFTFIGWNTERNGTGETYRLGDTLPDNAPERTFRKITLYAQWSPNDETAYERALKAFRAMPGYSLLQNRWQEYKLVNVIQKQHTVVSHGKYCCRNEKGEPVMLETEPQYGHGLMPAAYELGICNVCAMTTLLNRASLLVYGVPGNPFTLERVLKTYTSFYTVPYRRLFEEKTAEADGYAVRLAAPGEGPLTGYVSGDTAPTEESVYSAPGVPRLKTHPLDGLTLEETEPLLRLHPEGLWLWCPSHAFVLTRYERTPGGTECRCIDSMQPEQGEIPIASVYGMTPEKLRGTFRVSYLTK